MQWDLLRIGNKNLYGMLLPRVRDWSGILLERSGKRYSGKPDGVAGTPYF